MGSQELEGMDLLHTVTIDVEWGKYEYSHMCTRSRGGGELGAEFHSLWAVYKPPWLVYYLYINNV